MVAISVSSQEDYSEVVISGNKIEIAGFVAYFFKARTANFPLKQQAIPFYPDLLQQAEIKLIPDSQGLVFTQQQGTCFIFSGDFKAIQKLATFLESFLVFTPGEHCHFDSDVNADMLAPSRCDFVIKMEA